LRVGGGDDAAVLDDRAHAELLQPGEIARVPGIGGRQVARRRFVDGHAVDGELAGVELVGSLGIGVEGNAAVKRHHGGAVGEEGQAPVEVFDELAVDARFAWA